MGIADRDYVRKHRPPGGPTRALGPGGPRNFSVNTWLIIINIGVFVIGNIIFANVIAATPTYTERLDDVTDQEWDRRATIEPPMRLPQAQGSIGASNTFRRIVDTAPPTESGVPQVDPETGQPIRRLIGRELALAGPVATTFGHFSTGKFWTEGQIWRIFTFQFLHANGMHLILNMLGLFFFGRIVEEYLGSRRYLAFYLLGGVCGGLLYLALNILGIVGAMAGMPNLPLALFKDIYTPLIGASAGVFAIIIGAAYLRPREQILLFFVVPVPLRWAAYGFVAIAFFNLYAGGANAGGDAAHLGGALAGFILIRRPHVLRRFDEAASSVVGFVRGIGAKIGIGKAPKRGPGSPKRPAQNEIDRILEKVHAKGIASLTEKEQLALKRASEADAEEQRS